MDACTLSAFLPSAASLETLLATAGSLVMAASAITALIPTPEPGSRWAKVYRAIEIAAVVVGHAKDTGLMPPSAPQLEATVARLRHPRAD